MRELQSARVELDLKSALLEEPDTPLGAALRGYFLKSNSSVFTYVLRASDHPKRLCGFAQARSDQSGLAWRVVRIAPLLDHSEHAATIWYRLLLHLCIVAGERQVQRLFACLVEGSAAEDVFRQASFVAYCHEQVFCRSTSGAEARLSPRLRSVRSEDGLDVRRLWHRITPRPVLQAEGLDSTPGHSLLFETVGSGAEQGYVLRGDGREIWGYLHVSSRPRGVWLRLMVHPDARNASAEMLEHALAVLENHPQPIYCAVREYEGGLQAVLEDRGFAAIDAYSLLVKHTTVRVRQPLRKLVPALKKGAEIAPTVSRSEAGDC
jgi:hypothetical protein